MRASSAVFRAIVITSAPNLWLLLPATAAATQIEPEASRGSDAYRDDARRLATQAAEQYARGEYGAALDLFTRASRLYDAPTLKFWQARCLEKLGRLVDAEERYAEVARTEFDSNSPRAFIKAQRDSEAALEEIRKRVPTIKIVINNAKDISKVELDGRILPAPLVGAPIAVDPGTHMVTVTRSSGAVRTESVAIGESQAQEVYVNFERPTQTPLDPLLDSPTVASAPALDWQTVAGWSAIAAGSVGLGVGVFAGLRAMAKHDRLTDDCHADDCPPEQHARLDSFRTWRSVSTVGYAIGFLGLSTGTVFLLLQDADANTSVSLNPTGASLRHQF